jgi:hypothetical protein
MVDNVVVISGDLPATYCHKSPNVATFLWVKLAIVTKKKCQLQVGRIGKLRAPRKPNL